MLTSGPGICLVSAFFSWTTVLQSRFMSMADSLWIGVFRGKLIACAAIGTAPASAKPAAQTAAISFFIISPLFPFSKWVQSTILYYTTYFWKMQLFYKVALSEVLW